MSAEDFILLPSQALGAAAAASGIVFFSVALSSSTFPGKFAYDPSVGFSGLFSSLGAAAYSLPLTLLGVTGIALKKILKLLPQILIVYMILALILLWNENDYKLARKVDQLSTKYTLPVYHKTAMPVARFTQLSYDMGICWWDFQSTARTVVIRETASVIVDCTAVEWQKLTNDTVLFLGNLINLLPDFAINEGKQPFKVEIVLHYLGQALGDLRPILECACQELSFVYDLIFPLLTNSNLHAGLDRLVNTVYQILYVFIDALVQAFSGITLKRSGFSDSIDRPPKLMPVISSSCDFGYRTSAFIDDIIFVVCDVFVDSFVGSDTCSHVLPKFGPLIGSWWCTISYELCGIIDLMFHIDLVFKPDYQYLKYAEINGMFISAQNASNGIELFWQPFNNTYTTDIGTIMGESTRLVFHGIEWGKNFTVSIFYLYVDINGVQDFIINYNTTPVSTSYGRLRDASIDFGTQLNEPFGEFVKQIAILGQQPVSILYASLKMFATEDPSNINDYMLHDLQPQVQEIVDRYKACAIAIANFIRQFDETDSCVKYDPYPPFNGNLTNPSGTTLCAFANIYQDYGNTLSTVIDFPFNMFVETYTLSQDGFSFDDFKTLFHSVRLWIDGPMHIVYLGLRNDLSEFIGSFFGDVTCVCANHNHCPTEYPINPYVKNDIKNVIGAVIDLPGMLYYSTATIIDTIDDVLFSSAILDAGVRLVTGIMDTWGRAWLIVAGVVDLLTCAIDDPGSLNNLPWVIYGIFFDPMDQDSVRNKIDDVADVIGQVIQFVGDLITQGTGAIGTLAKKEINVFIDQILNAQMLPIINDNVVCFVNQYPLCYINKIYEILKCFDKLNGFGHGTVTYNIPFPNLPTNLNLGLLSSISGSFVRIINDAFPDYISLPLPNIIQPLVDFIDCVSSKAHWSTSCNCTKCYGDPTTALITSCMQPINDIPDLQKRDEGSSPQPTNETESGLEYDLFSSTFNNYTATACSMYMSAMTNESYPDVIRLYYADQYTKCVISAQTIVPFNLIIYGNYTSEWASPYTFTSIQNVISETFKFGYKVLPIVAHETGCYFSAFGARSSGNISALVNQTYCTDWNDYIHVKNTTASNFTLQLGQRLENWRINITEGWTSGNSSTTLTSLFTSFLRGVNYTYQIVTKPVTSDNQTLIGVMFDSYSQFYDLLHPSGDRKRFMGNDPDRSILRTIFVDWISHNTSSINNVTRSGLNTTKLYNRAVDNVYTLSDNIYNYFATTYAPKTKRAMLNRKGLSNLLYISSHMYKEYAYRSGYFDKKNMTEKKNEYLAERNLPMLLDMAYVSSEYDLTNNPMDLDSATISWHKSTALGREKIKLSLALATQLANDNRQTKRELVNPFSNGTFGICNVPDVGGINLCINCTILSRILDTLTERLFECIDMTSYNYDLLQDEFLDPFVSSVESAFMVADGQSDGIFSAAHVAFTGENYTYMSLRQQLDTIKARQLNYGNPTAIQASQLPFFISPLQAVANAIENYILVPACKAILGIHINFSSLMNDIKAFFVDNATSVSNSIYYYVRLYADTQPSMNCKKLAEKGFGLGNITLSVFLVYLSLVLITILASRLSSTLLLLCTPLWVLSFQFVLTLNYGVSPMSLPAVPMCLADDIYKVLKDADVPCLSWHRILPGWTSQECPNDSIDYARDFIDCSQAPYYFNNPWRIFWFTFELMIPEVNQWMLTTQTGAFSWFREIDGMSTMMTFDYNGTSTIPAIYKTCFILRLGNYYVMALYFGILASIGASVGLAAVVAISTVGSTIQYGSMLSITLSSMLAGDMKGLARTYTSSQQYLTQNLMSKSSLGGHNKGPTQVEAAGASHGRNEDSTFFKRVRGDYGNKETMTEEHYSLLEEAKSHFIYALKKTFYKKEEEEKDKKRPKKKRT